MMDSFDRRSSKPIVVISTPSMYIVPEAGSTRRNNATPREDLPRKHTRTDIRIPYLVLLYDWREYCLLIGPICFHKSLCLPENWSELAQKVI